MRSLLVLALLALSACGGTLYTSEGLPALPQGSTCGADQVACPSAGGGNTCVTEDASNCGACGNVCTGTLPARASHACSPATHQCTFSCADGYLRTATGCESAVALAAGDSHTCAITEGSGSLKCWGGNDDGQVTGTATPGAPVSLPHQLAGAGTTAVAAGARHTCAVISGSVQCWGASPALPASRPAGVVALSAGLTHTCAIANGATTRDLICWGTGTAATAAPALTAVDAISSGSNHACAVHAGGVTCWGQNDRSQTLGGSPIPAGSGITLIAAGADFTCAANSNATASPGADPLCWGDNSASPLPQLPQLANPQTTPATPLGAGGGGRPIARGRQLVSLVAGARHTCVAFLPAEPDGVGCFGEASFGKLGGNFLGDIVALASNWPGTTVLAAGGDHTCAVEPGTGLVKCWGRNDAGQLGSGTADAASHAAPVLVSGR